MGGGWIGLEVAAAARSQGNDVTIVEQGPTPLHTVLGSELGEVFARLHGRHGVDCACTAASVGSAAPAAGSPAS